MIVDLLLVLVVPLLMAYALIGEWFHEIAGMLMLLLLAVHQILNRAWYKALFKGKYHARRIAQTVLDCLLLVLMVLQPLSGILMSKHVFAFLNIQSGTSVAREIHLLVSYWGLVLLSIHAGTHLVAPLTKLYRKSKLFFIAVISAMALGSAWGIYAFVKREFAAYMFRRSVFAFYDFESSRVLFIFDYLTVMLLFAVAGASLMYLLKTVEQRKKNKLSTKGEIDHEKTN